MEMTIMWLALGVILFVIEGLTVGLVCMWFGIGAIVTMLCSFVVTNIYIQWLVFIVVSVVMLVLLRPLAKRTIQASKQQTNASSLIGRTALLTEGITEEHSGRVKLGDISWIAVNDEGDTINKDERVKIVAIRGNKLVVSKI